MATIDLYQVRLLPLVGARSLAHQGDLLSGRARSLLHGARVCEGDVGDTVGATDRFVDPRTFLAALST